MNYIKIYRFYDAPQELRGLSNNGGDEDWIAVVPSEIYKKEHDYISWIEDGSFGCCSVDKFEADHNIIFIGCHS